MILASQSPRRKELLERAGFSFTVHAADIDESPLPGETPPQLVERLARSKAHATVPFARETGDDLIVAAVEANYGVTCEMTGMGVATPPVVNHEKYTPRVHNSFRKFITTDIVTKTEGKMGGEDFSFFQQTGVPGVFVNYGVASPDTPGSDRPLHNPGFSPDEGGIAIGAMCYAQVAVD